MRDEDGVDLGRTWGDVGREVKDAIAMIGTTKTLRKLEGEDWTVYRVGDNLIRADVKVDTEGG